jgi:hypothetical protein
MQLPCSFDDATSTKQIFIHIQLPPLNTQLAGSRCFLSIGLFINISAMEIAG